MLTGLSGANIEEILVKAIRNAIISGNEVAKQNYYEEFFKFKGILSQSVYSEKEALRMKAKYLRQCDDKVFSLQVIAEVLNSSKTTISKLVKESEE